MNLLKKVFVATLILFSVTGCLESSNDDPATIETPEATTVVDVAAGNADFSTLVSLLQSTGLDMVLDNPAANFTVFAPTNAAFDALGDETLAVLSSDPDLLSSILLYHVLTSEVGSAAATAAVGSTVETANGRSVAITEGGTGVGIRINTSSVTAVDIAADNGVIHVVDSVIIPPEIEDLSTNGVGTIALTKGLNTLLTVLGVSGLDAVVTDPNTEFTIFAPTDDAFAALGDDVINRLLTNTDVLSEVLLQHVIVGAQVNAVTAMSLTGNTATMGNGAELPVVLTEDGALTIGGATVIATNILAENATIHVIDSVIVGDIEIPDIPAPPPGGGGDTDYGTAAFTGAFGGATVVDGVYTFPTGAEGFAGFANENADMYPMSFPNGGEITFTAAIPDGGVDTSIRFRFEFNPFPDIDPAYDTESVTISGGEATYTITIPPQGENTFSSFLLYVNERDQPVAVSNVNVTAFGAGGSGEETYGPAAITGPFGGTTIVDGVYTWPASAEVWGGFANENADMYPMSFPNGGQLSFTGAIPDGGVDTSVRFVFEFMPFPDVDPSFATADVTISDSSATYTLDIPPQGDNTFSSFLFYINDRDQGVIISDVIVTAYGSGGASAPELSTNGDFEGGSIDPWFGAAMIATEDSNSYASLTTDVAGEPFSVNMSQSVELEMGASYTLEFDARATVDKSILAGIGLNEAPWYADVQSVSLTGTWTTFTLDVAAIDSATNTPFGGMNDRIIFDAGAEVGTVHIDNVSFKKKLTTNSGGTGGNPSTPELAGYTLVWADEFNAPQLDETTWNYELGDGTAQGIPGWGNNELQIYTNDLDNVSIGTDEGESVLMITAREDGSGGYTSARLTTQGKASFRYGKIIGRMKLPETQGLWPAFWMLGDNIDQVSWPGSGEIDIMELVGSRPDESIHTIHYVNANFAYNYTGEFYQNNANFSDEYHEFMVDWTPEWLTFYVDGDLAYQVAIEEGMKEFNRSFFMLLNVAVGGNLPGNPDGSSVFPQTMYVDYVRYYQLDGFVPDNPPALDVNEETIGGGDVNAGDGDPLVAIQTGFNALGSDIVFNRFGGGGEPTYNNSSDAVDGAESIEFDYPGGAYGGAWMVIPASDLSAYAGDNLVFAIKKPASITNYEVKLEGASTAASMFLQNYSSTDLGNGWEEYSIPLSDFTDAGLDLSTLTIPFALWNPQDDGGNFLDVTVLFDNIRFEAP